MTLNPSAIRLLANTFGPVDDERTRWSLERLGQLLDSSLFPFSRTWYEPGHITASGLVFTPNRAAVLLVYHERLDRWLQPGGHIEPSDTSVVDAARREVFEETGIRVDDVAASLIAIDVHEIPAAHDEPTHLHHDFMFCFQLDRSASPAPDHRALWCAIDELERYNVDEPLQRSVARALT